MGGKIILNGKEYASSTPGGGASSFADLDDVDLTFLQDGEFPQYNSLTQKWENVTLTKVNDVKVNGTSVVNSSLVANIKSYKEVTQAEYEALPASKTSDGIAYFITDAVEAEGYPPLIYSLQEREVGVWTDGRPLYQKSYAKTLPSAHDHDNGNSFLIDSDVSYIDKLVDSNGFIYDSGGACSALNGGISNMAGWSYGIHKNANSELVLYGATQTTYIGGGMVLLTIQYTKTTDTPGQGIWAGNGAMAHHYSTDEVIVGTWIDGKPVYEKSISISNLVSGDNTIQHGISNFGKLISVSGYFAMTDDSTYNPIPCISPYNEWSARVRDFTSTTFIVEMGSTIATYYTKGVVTLQYTKTTD